MVAPDPEVVALAEEIEEILLPGPRKRVTEEVRAWGEKTGSSLVDERLLEAYNAAVTSSQSVARERLEVLADDAEKRRVLLRLLSEPRATDLDRTLTLEALSGRLRPGELDELGRVSARQRPGAIAALLELLASMDHPQARFLERKVVPVTSPDMPSRPVALPVHVEEGSPRDTLFAALALDEDGMAGLPEDDQLRRLLAQAADAEDDRLVEIGRSGSGLSDYESVLRRELHLLVLLAGLPVGDRLLDRARDSLLAADTSRLEWRIAPHLPPDELALYIRRSLSQDNRRTKAARAAVALRCIALLPAAASEGVKESVLAATADGRDEVRFEAAAALTGFRELPNDEMSLLVGVVNDLPDDLRVRLQPHLSEMGSAIEVMDFTRVIEWALSAPVDEAAARAIALFETWEERAKHVSPHDAETAIGVCSRALARESSRLPDDVANALASATLAWLKDRGGTAAATRSLIAGWQGFSDFALARFAAYDLNARSSRRLLREAMASGADPAETLARGAEVASTLSSERYSSVAAPELRFALEHSPELVEPAAASVSDDGLRALLAAAIEVAGDLGRRRDELESASGEESTRALGRAHAQVLGALELAERDSVKDKDLAAQLSLIRRALGFHEADVAIAPSSAVLSWRKDVAARFPSMAVVDDGVQPLAPGDSLDDLMAVMLELDPRVHGRGVVPAQDRKHYARDLSAVVAAYAQRSDGDDLPRTASPQLREDVFRAAAGDRGDNASQLRALLSGGAAKAPARQLGIEARQSDFDSIATAVEGLDVAAARSAVPLVALTLVGEHRAFARAAEAAQTQETRAAAEIARKLAIPFQAIESRLFSYFRLRAILADVGWAQVADYLGDEVSPHDLEPERYSVRSDAPPDAAEVTFLVRSLGIQIDGQVVEPALVERVSSVREQTEDDDDRH